MFNPKTDAVLIDISFWQNDPMTPASVDFNTMKESGALGVILRAGQGAREDISFSRYRADCISINYPFGVYWFYDSRIEPISQANAFLSIVGKDYPVLGIWLDYEETYNGRYSDIKNFRAFTEAVEDLALRKYNKPLVGIYTGPSYWIANGPKSEGDFAYFKAFPLWIANYETPKPLIPKPWTEYLFWQYDCTGEGATYGVETNNVDKNIFAGTREEFKAFFGLTDMPQPPAEEKDYMYILTVNTRALNGRSSPDGQVVFSAGFKQGDTLIATEVVVENNQVSKWYEIIEAWRNGEKIKLPMVPLFAGNGGTQNLLKQSAVIEIPQSGQEPSEISLTIEIDGYEPETVTLNSNKPL